MYIYENYIKRTIDIVLASLCLVPLGILLLVVSPLIKKEDGGKVFYMSDRIGKDCKIYRMYKIRTMVENAPNILNHDGSTYNAENDIRQTKIGKFLRKTSLDELPQVLNICRNEMSFIGPRPIMKEQLNSFTTEELGKMKVLPGITGYNQAYHRNKLGNHEERMNDVWYANHISFKLDLKIFLRTIWTVLHPSNVYRN